MVCRVQKKALTTFAYELGRRGQRYQAGYQKKKKEKTCNVLASFRTEVKMSG